MSIQFHSIQYADGTISKGALPIESLNNFYNGLKLPNINGKTVLDIGAAEGFYSIECARNGAIVTALNADEAHHKSCIDNIEKCEIKNVSAIKMDLYELNNIKEKFDIVLLMGVIYHLRHPLLGIDLAVNKAKELIVVESHCCINDKPIMEFYQFDELNHDASNWWGPSPACIEQMLQSAGCKNTKIVNFYYYSLGSRTVIHGYK